MRTVLAAVFCVVIATRSIHAQSIQFIPVEQSVKLEVLDWGGVGPPVVVLAGLGNTAHIFNAFAQRLTGTYHVYGVTRRGYGASSAPIAGYEADRLGDDVLAVIDSLRLHRPVLIGHSIAGQELSSIGSRYPNRVSALVYLDAGYWYAYYDSLRGDMSVDVPELVASLSALNDPLTTPREQMPIVKRLLETDLPRFERQLRELDAGFTNIPPALLPQLPPPPPTVVAIRRGRRKYTRIDVPILAIFAWPQPSLRPPPGLTVNAAQQATADSSYRGKTKAQIDAFERGVPSAKVVRIPYADHYVFRSHESDVLREIRAFLDSLSTSR